MVSTAAFHARVRGSVPGLGGLKETKMFLPHPRVKVSIAGSLRDREVACSASDRQGSNFESCVWRTVSSQSSHHPQEVLLAQFSLYVHKGGLKPDSFHFISYLQYITLISFCGQNAFCRKGKTWHCIPPPPVYTLEIYPMQKNELNRALGHFCAHTDLVGPGEPPEDCEMTLPSRHRIRNSNPGGLRPRTLPLGHGGSHNTEFYEWVKI